MNKRQFKKLALRLSRDREMRPATYFRFLRKGDAMDTQVKRRWNRELPYVVRYDNHLKRRSRYHVGY
jgi:hypothetical protein